MGFLKYVFNTTKWNADPTQQRLAQLIIDVAEGCEDGTDIFVFVKSQGWSRSDQGNRLTHALSMAKVFRGDLYPEAKEICRLVYVAL